MWTECEVLVKKDSMILRIFCYKIKAGVNISENRKMKFQAAHGPLSQQ